MLAGSAGEFTGTGHYVSGLLNNRAFLFQKK